MDREGFPTRPERARRAAQVGVGPRGGPAPSRRPSLVLVCGLPAAGKTTLARRLASAYPAIRLCPDEWMSRLGVDLRDEAFRERLEAEHWEVARDALASGASVILESGFWRRFERDEKRMAGRDLGASVELRYLDVTIEELVRRVERRDHGDGARITREDLAAWARAFEAPDAEELALFDPPRVRI